jgi:hypothetical protein
MIRFIVFAAAFSARIAAQGFPPKPLEARVPSTLAEVFPTRTFARNQCRAAELDPSPYYWRCSAWQGDTALIAEFDSARVVQSAFRCGTSRERPPSKQWRAPSLESTRWSPGALYVNHAAVGGVCQMATLAFARIATAIEM